MQYEENLSNTWEILQTSLEENISVSITYNSMQLKRRIIRE